VSAARVRKATAGEPTIRLEPHQAGGVAHLLRAPSGGLVMDPGTMKTATLLSAFHVLKKKGVVDRLLVLAPLLPAYEVWPAEVEKWGFPYRVVVLHGPKKFERAAERADVYVCNYEGLEWLASIWPEFKGRHRWWLCCDEAQKVKRTDTVRFAALKPMLNDFRRRSILTGTPAPNSLEDLYGQVYVLDQGERLGGFITHYRREFFQPTGYQGQFVIQKGAEGRIYRHLAGLLYRVSDKVLRLKPIRYAPVWVTLGPKARKLYERMEAELVAEVKAGVTLTAVNAGVLTSKLRQIANGAVYDGERVSHRVHGAKLEALENLVGDLQGQPLLVCYEFTPDGERIAEALGAPVISGKVKPRDRGPILAAFNRGETAVLVCQSSVIALGGNLQSACHHLAWFGLTYNLEHYIQAARRLHRKGQRKAVFVHQIMARDSIDELILRALGHKDRVQQRLFQYLREKYR
jgi:SNF2 family DNA or RNA helicase